MSGFDTIVSQVQPIRTLKRFLEKQTIPHALLFTGIEGVGKRMTALTFAMAANCLKHQTNDTPSFESPTSNGHGPKVETKIITEPCGNCSSCKKIRAKNHPDILFIEPEGAMIKIHQIRDIFQTLALKPYEARVRVVIIADSHTMNPSAANALLKMLEEPPDRTMLILTAKEANDLLPTIVSRCRQIRFNPVAKEDIAKLLETNRQIEPVKAGILAAMAGGSYTRAVTMGRSNWIQRRKWLITAGGLAAPESLAKRPKSFLLAFSEKLAKNRSMVEDSLYIMKTWLRDLVVYKIVPDKIINKDLVGIIAEASKKMAIDDLLKKLEAVEQTQRDIKSNMNLRLCLDVLMLRLAATTSIK